MITYEQVKKFFDYETETGLLIWRLRPEYNKTWNTRYAGKEGGSFDKNGYRQITINRKMYLVHRVIYFWMTAEWPEEIDHRNGNPSDNRWENLRPATHAENMQNMKKFKNNRSGFCGVAGNAGKWQVYLGHKYIGLFETVEEANMAYCDAKMKFHQFQPTVRG